MSSRQRSPLLRLSRPRFWVYLLGPFLIGIVAAPNQVFSFRLLALGLFFTVPANLLIYGFNDVFDYETDKHNSKKQGYEQLLSPDHRQGVLRILTLMGMLGLLLVLPPSVPQAVKWAMTGFYFFGLGYSVPPIRAKTKPFLDAYFNVLYVFPALVSYGLLTGGSYPALQLFLAGMFWCAAMHAFSAIPDIRADQKAKIKTIATVLGKQNTLIFCAFNYAAAAILSYQYLGWFALAGGLLYLWLMYVSSKTATKEAFFRYYTYFPRINMIMGAMLFFWVLLVVK